MGLLTAVSGNRAEAEEVAQDAFFGMLEHWGAVRDYANPYLRCAGHPRPLTGSRVLSAVSQLVLASNFVHPVGSRRA